MKTFVAVRNGSPFPETRASSIQGTREKLLGKHPPEFLQTLWDIAQRKGWSIETERKARK